MKNYNKAGYYVKCHRCMDKSREITRLCSTCEGEGMLPVYTKLKESNTDPSKQRRATKNKRTKASKGKRKGAKKGAIGEGEAKGTTKENGAI